MYMHTCMYNNIHLTCIYVYMYIQEDVMSKTQQVKQYKKQIDQLGGEVATYKEQAAAHMRQVSHVHVRVRIHCRRL